MEAIGVSTLVERLCALEEMDAAKPDPAIVHVCAQCPGRNPGSSYMVGDSPESVIQGALNLGFHPALNRQGKCEQVEEIAR